MGETIRDGRGNAGSGAEYIAGVSQDHYLYVVGSIVSQPSSSAVIAGSVEVFSSTGSVQVYGTLTTTAGSEVYVKGGSIQTYNPIGIGSVWFGGGIGSVTITNSLPAIGSYNIQNISGTFIGISGIVNQGTTPWTISGTSTIAGSAFVTGSINISTSLTQLGSYTRNIGSEAWVFGSVFSTGSINISTSLPSIGSYTTQMVSGLASSVGISGAVNQGTTPWAVSGTATVSGIVNLGNNWAGTGSVVISGTSIPPWRGLGSIYGIGVGSIWVAGSLNLATNVASIGSYTTQNIIGSVIQLTNRLESAHFFSGTTVSGGTTLSQASGSIWISGMRTGMIYLNGSKTGTGGTDLQLTLQFSPDSGSNYYKYSRDFWNDLRMVPAQLGSFPFLCFPLPSPIDSNVARLVISGTGQTTTNFYKLTVMGVFTP